ncbi:MAG: DUF72 domain-containing protein [Nitrospirae bacterium]|nr:DUF72 domain-containing protein [Nitrospirota bacterium]
MPKCKIGCSGFLYDSWKNAFYPEDLPQKRWLSYYVRKLDALELSITFYRLLKKEAFERWYVDTPPGFAFSLKGSRFITHIKKLKDVALPLETFFNVTLPLHEKFEVVLWQFPPNLKVNIRILQDFIEEIKKYSVRHVFEFRQASWLSKKVIQLLSESNIAICMSDWPEFLSTVPVTADFVYIQRQGAGGDYAANYETDKLKADAKMIRELLKQGKDVYIFFNNDAFAYAPQNAMELKKMLENAMPESHKDIEFSKHSLPLQKKASQKTEAGKDVRKMPQKKTTAKKPSEKKTAKKKKKKRTLQKKASKKPVSKKTAAKKKPAKKSPVKKKPSGKVKSKRK